MRLPTFDSLPFVLRAVIDPVRALDLIDDAGLPDHTKVVPFMVLVAIVVLKVLHNPFTVAEILVITPASFGAAMYRQFLRSKQLAATSVESVSTKTVRTILERRDAEDGVDPTHE